MLPDLTLREERPADRAEALEVERLAFGSDAEPAIVEAVRDLDGSFGLVAVDATGRIVGHVQLSRAWIGGAPVVSLGPIGVRPEVQRQGIGGALVRAALDAARERDEIAVILLGSPRYYPRFGFRPVSERGLRNPYTGTQEDGFVVREEDCMLVALDERAEALRGPIRWHPAFGPPTVDDDA